MKSRFGSGPTEDHSTRLEQWLDSITVIRSAPDFGRQTRGAGFAKRSPSCVAEGIEKGPERMRASGFMPVASLAATQKV